MKVDPLERLYNRNYGLPNTVRRAALDTAEATSVKDAAASHKVSRSTVYTWRRHVRAYELGWNDAAVSGANKGDK